jgi:hypothetical protein
VSHIFVLHYIAGSHLKSGISLEPVVRHLLVRMGHVNILLVHIVGHALVGSSGLSARSILIILRIGVLTL